MSLRAATSQPPDTARQAFDFRKILQGEEKIGTRQQRGKLLCSYAPKHIYQYANIGANGEVPVEKVVEAVIADLHYAARLLNDPEYVRRFEDWPRQQ
jgi:hypothetical protein